MRLLPLLLILAGLGHAASDTTALPRHRFLIGRGLHDLVGDNLGVEYQMRLGGPWHLAVGTGSDSPGGYRLGAGLARLWPHREGFRFLAQGAVVHASGHSYPEAVEFGGQWVEFTSSPSWVASLSVGVQVKVTRWAGIQALVGAAKVLRGGGHEIYSSTDRERTERQLSGKTGSGMQAGIKLFKEW